MSTLMPTDANRDASIPEIVARQDTEIFDGSVARVLANPEVFPELRSVPLEKQELKEHLFQLRDELSRGVAAERRRWIDAAIRARRPRPFIASERRSRIGLYKDRTWLYRVAFGLAVVFLVLIAAAIIWFAVGYVGALFKPPLAAWRVGGVASLTSAALVYLIFWPVAAINTSRVRKRVSLEYQSAEAAARLEYEAVLEERLLGEIRDQINMNRPSGSYDCQLRIDDAPGLAEIYGDKYRITSAAGTRLAGLLGQMPGGTIGLAGPRGVGKTCLIREYCPEEIYVNRYSGDLSLLVSAPVEYAPKEFVLHLLATLCRAYLRFREVGDGGDALVPKPRNSIRGRLAVATQDGVRRPGDGNDPVSRAANYLREARYLQTYTTTLGASLSAPGGVAGLSGQSAAAAAEVPRTYPELVSEFCSFLRTVALEVRKAGGRVFIGIDELDKISDGEQAQRFVNELKVVLGVPNCYYLIALSDDAMAAYEMRGLPVRDAFDSAFDEIVHVDYLRLEDSRRLLSKRVIGMSEPFICLCQCISGGLPRDLIRVARHVVGAGQGPEPDSDQLDAICRQLVVDELSGKLYAVGVKLAGHRLRWTDSGLLHDIQQLVSVKSDHAELVTGLQRLVSGLADPRSQVDRANNSLAIPELITYLHYLLTLLQVFTRDLSREQVEAGLSGSPAPAGAFDQLCFAKQTLGADPRWAWLTTEAFRDKWSLMPAYAYPAPDQSN
jgi:hypothetical protein